ncbi:hypothetical protein F2P56_019585 [Juglans regia]|uniref:Uncharacterized protein n=1 Tax=Juglans regia TaxID=51240 RepID=A0A833UNM0_JUGRE|nr:hypothetical protein F2P56_019585 [Juglans regia]
MHRPLVRAPLRSVAEYLCKSKHSLLLLERRNVAENLGFYRALMTTKGNNYLWSTFILGCAKYQLHVYFIDFTLFKDFVSKQRLCICISFGVRVIIVHSAVSIPKYLFLHEKRLTFMYIQGKGDAQLIIIVLVSLYLTNCLILLRLIKQHF